MSKSYTVGYMPKPSYSGTKYEELKDVLKESGIISENTPDNAIPTVVEESLVDLKPENIRGNVKIGNVTGNVIETLEDVNAESVEKYTIQEFSTNNYFKEQLYKNGDYIYGLDAKDNRIGVYNKKTDVYTNTGVGQFSANNTTSNNEWYKNPTTEYIYLAGQTGNLYYTGRISYFYKDEEHGNMKECIYSTVRGVAHVGEYTYFLCSGGSYANKVSEIFRFKKDSYEKINFLESVTISLRVLCVVNDTIYFSCRDSKNTAVNGIYKLTDTHYELVYQTSISSDSVYGFAYKDSIFVGGSGISNVLLIKENVVSIIYNQSISFNDNYVVLESAFGNYYLCSSKSLNLSKIYCLIKDSDTLIQHTFSNGSEFNVFNDGVYEYIFVKSYDTNVYKLNNGMFEIVFTFPTSSNKYIHTTAQNVTYIGSNTKLIRFKNGEITEYPATSSYISIIFEDQNNNILICAYDLYVVNESTLDLYWDNPTSYTFHGVVKCPNNDIYLLSVNSDSNYEHNIVALVRNNTVTPMFKFRGSIAIGQYIVQDENTLVMKLTSDAIFMIKETNGAFITYRIK